MYFQYWNIIPLFGRLHRKKNIEATEKVQRRFTKRLSGLRDYSYSELLQKLNIQSLELRRIHYDLTLTYQVLKCQEFFKLENVVIANALQLEAARRRAVPLRFNFVARAKFEVAQPIPAVLRAFYCLYVTLRCDLEL